MSLHAPEHDATFRQASGRSLPSRCNELPGWTELRRRLSRLAFLHGAVALEAAQVFGESKPASCLEFGLDAWLLAVSMRV
jgi:hypothetical protein